MLLSENSYKEPQYTVISKNSNIEIRQYNQYIVAKTSIDKGESEEDNNMFRTLASYIFGGNTKNQSIPMTAPVTTYNDGKTYNMIFYMLSVDDSTDLPVPNNSKINLETFTLGKCAVLEFSWFTSESRVKKFKAELSTYLDENNLKALSPFMVNRYDPPWRLPFMRRNEIIVKIQ
jgi:hypothetical protein